LLQTALWRIVLSTLSSGVLHHSRGGSPTGLSLPVNSEGGTASLSPFRRSPHLHRGSLPPLLGRGMNPSPATKGHIPLEPPTDLFPRGKPQGMRQISERCKQDDEGNLAGVKANEHAVATLFPSTLHSWMEGISNRVNRKGTENLPKTIGTSFPQHTVGFLQRSPAPGSFQ
jgi:hypothetical protein